jgi:predicted DNA-binding transcriptional regulator YafY
MSQLQRCIRLYQAFESRGTLATREAARLLGTSPKQALRDIHALQAAGIPIARVGAGRTTRYRLPDAFRRHGLRFSQGDAFALHFGRQLLGFAEGTALTSWLEELRGKLDTLLPADADERDARLQKRLVFLSEPYRPYGPKDDTLNEVLTALLDERELDLSYRPRGGEARHWERLWPLALVIYRRGLYLLARFPSSLRPLRLAVDRIVEAQRGEPFRYPADFDPRRELSRAFGIFDDGRPPSVVRLRFEPRVADLVAERVWHPTAHTTELDDGSIELSLRATGRELVRLALEWGDAVEVLKPTWLREAVARELESALAHYR